MIKKLKEKIEKKFLQENPELIGDTDLLPRLVDSAISTYRDNPDEWEKGKWLLISKTFPPLGQRAVYGGFVNGEFECRFAWPYVQNEDVIFNDWVKGNRKGVADPTHYMVISKPKEGE